jgi:aminoglycoside phosphotransferase (APT) family kinase protein
MTETMTEKFSGTMPVREQHQMDVASLQRYMEAHVEGFSGTLEVEQFKGGQSCPTYRLSAGGKHYVLRRKPPGKLLPSAHAVDREYRVITALHDTGVPVARTYALCEDPDVVGTAFYIMDYADGRIFWDPTLPELDRAERAKVFDAMNAVIAALHSVDCEAVGLGDFGKPGNYFARQIGRWSKQYRASETEHIEPMNRLMEWLPENVPEGDETTVVHGDYRLDNMVFHPTEPRVLAVLDWELSTLGHPLGDFSYNCMVFRFKPDQFNGLAGLDLDALGIPSEADYIAAYCRRTGRDGIANWDFYMAYNMFRIAAILQGIMGRFVDGTASSAHAAERGKQVRPLAEFAWAQAEKVMEGG